MATRVRPESIEKLTGNNYTLWRLNVSLMLEAAKLLKVVNGTDIRHTTDKDKQ
ncbi:unnamed protein product, partial [Allacma fusca]